MTWVFTALIIFYCGLIYRELIRFQAFWIVVGIVVVSGTNLADAHHVIQPNRITCSPLGSKP